MLVILLLVNESMAMEGACIASEDCSKRKEYEELQGAAKRIRIKIQYPLETHKLDEMKSGDKEKRNEELHDSSKEVNEESLSSDREFMRGVGIIFQTNSARCIRKTEKFFLPGKGDEGSEELTALYLNYALMRLGICQWAGSTQCCEPEPQHRGENRHGRPFKKSRVCGDPAVPFIFPLTFDFNESVDDAGYSFMTYAVARNCRVTVQLLIERGAGVNKVDQRGVLPLQEAQQRELVSRKGCYKGMIALLRKYGATA